MKDKNINNLFSLIARQNEVIRRVKNGGLSMSNALSLTQAILDGKFPTKNDNFPQFAHLLRPLSIQAENLRNLNKQMPKGMRVPDSWFDELDVNSDHIQSIEDLETFFVVPSNRLKDVIDYQINLIDLTQPGIFYSPSFDSEVDGAYLDDTANKSMFAKPGIYRVRINLVSFWDKEEGISNDKVRLLATQCDIKLAGLAAVGAYALQDPELCQLQDGENLPHCDIAELRCGDDGSRVLSFSWDSDGHEIYLNSYESSFNFWYEARPSFVD